MYSGNSGSSSMLYGGPLGTYLSGIYQPVKSINQTSKPIRRSASRTGSNNLISPGSSLSYTPQPRRRTEAPDTSRYSSLLSDGPTKSSGIRSRPLSYYNSSPSRQLPSTSSISTSSTPKMSSITSSSSSGSRPLSAYTRNTDIYNNISSSSNNNNNNNNNNDNSASTTNNNSTDYQSRLKSNISPSKSYSHSTSNCNDDKKSSSSSSSLDYKKLYEEELTKTSQLKKEIIETEKELEKVKVIIDKKKNVLEDNNKIMNTNFAKEMDSKELELLRGEGNKLKAENRALSRVVARLSREK